MSTNENIATDWVAVPRTEPDDDYLPQATAYADLTEAEFLRGDE